MTPAHEDWSDSDEDALSEVETSVLLGLPDGAIESVIDISDAAVSRIGGQPAFLPSKVPPFSSSYCKNCSNPSELLVQTWCPFEDSPMDRALYIWGCARGGCQGEEGSFRAWRGLRLNREYAAKLAQKLANRKKELADAEAAKKKQPMCNPFSMQTSPVPGPFGLGSQVFSGDSPTASLVAQALEKDRRELSDNESEPSTSSDDASSLITAMASATIAGSEWESAPSYTALYLSTASEYLPPPQKGKLPPGEIQDDPEDNCKEHKDASWAFESYENSFKMDQVFERFTKRASHEPEQCVRYELNGTPLPFGSDKVFDTLFPAPSASLLPVTGQDIKVVRTPKRTYDGSSIPPCPICKSRRVFEVQLMPNLINILTKPGEKRQKVMTDDERRIAVEKTLSRGDGGMEWGTCMVFSCEKDCCLDDDGKGEAGDCWREEVVLVQWDG